jgi:hypothetical protein
VITKLVPLRPRQAELAPEVVADAEHLTRQLVPQLAALPGSIGGRFRQRAPDEGARVLGNPRAERDREVRHASPNGDQEQQQHHGHE